ncbi:hypothetical protein TNCV_3610491 [Trichonephila clavipes]|nr:hypothetical protein TNCV_3610491 [Trichonephila clavipes]
MSPLQLTHRSFALQSALSWPTSAHLEQVGWPRQTVLNVQIVGIESNAADLECMVELGNGFDTLKIRCRNDASRKVQGGVGTPNCNTNPKATVFGIPKEPVLETAELITSRLTGAGSLLPPVYGEAWAKGHATGTPDSTFPGTGRRTRQTCGSDSKTSLNIT